MTQFELLEGPTRLSSVKKAAAVRAAKRGQRPNWLSPQQWAWNVLNPNGIRRNK